MNREVRTVRRDGDLHIEACRFSGVLHDFPNHFHDHYVVGAVEKGKRHLVCNGREYTLGAGDMILFNPMDPHACRPLDAAPMDYRALNIGAGVMGQACAHLTGRNRLPRFPQPVLRRSSLCRTLAGLHAMILDQKPRLHREEGFALLMEALVRDHCDAAAPALPAVPAPAMDRICEYLRANCQRSVTLDELGALAGMSKYHLLRTFTRHTGITPYCYLETLRIARARELLQRGVSPADAALQAGFCDQSHFSNHFKKLIGLTPGRYMKTYSADA